jgi:hypothetical protein
LSNVPHSPQTSENFLFKSKSYQYKKPRSHAKPLSEALYVLVLFVFFSLVFQILSAIILPNAAKTATQEKIHGQNVFKPVDSRGRPFVYGLHRRRLLASHFDHRCGPRPFLTRAAQAQTTTETQQ